jgi:hypothetical protein
MPKSVSARAGGCCGGALVVATGCGASWSAQEQPLRLAREGVSIDPWGINCGPADARALLEAPGAPGNGEAARTTCRPVIVRAQQALVWRLLHPSSPRPTHIPPSLPPAADLPLGIYSSLGAPPSSRARTAAATACPWPLPPL